MQNWGGGGGGGGGETVSTFIGNGHNIARPRQDKKNVT